MWKVSGPTGNFPDRLETFQTIWKLSRLSGNFPDWLETFQTGLNLFQTLWEVSRLAGNFPDCTGTFQTVKKLSRLSGNFPSCMETFQTVWTNVTIDFFQFLLRLNYVFCWKPKLPIWLEKGNNFGRCWPFSILANWHVTNCYNLCNLWIWLDSCTDRLHPNRRLKGITFYLSSSIFLWIIKEWNILTLSNANAKNVQNSSFVIVVRVNELHCNEALKLRQRVHWQQKHPKNIIGSQLSK